MEGHRPNQPTVAQSTAESQQSTDSTVQRFNVRRSVLWAGLLLCLAYGLQVYFSANSSLIYIPYIYKNSDMHANLLWANTIVEQGWLNPKPHHPYNDWMQAVGTYPEFLKWWGGEAVFQQSPLYAYLLALFRTISDDLVYVLIFQAVLGVLLCVAIGRIAFLMTGRAEIGWTALILAGAYAPFYAYSTAVLRDPLGWTITAWVIVALLELDRIHQPSRRHYAISGTVGALFGLGFLARETFAIIVLLAGAILMWRFSRRKLWTSAASLALGFIVCVTPLAIRNAVVGAPVLSTSNRFAEVFIMGNARGAHPALFSMPSKTRSIMESSKGHSAAVITETIRSHDNIGQWLRLQWRKAVALLDPFESCDNLSLEFVENISPLVKWGLKHWMLIIPGIAGCILGIVRREKRQAWLWVMLPLLLVGVFVALPLSRYRQSLMILWIPWAAYLLVELIRPLAERFNDSTVQRFNGQRIAFACAVVIGWILSLGPLARMPSRFHDRSTEYLMSVHIYQELGQMDKAHHMASLIRKKFPEEKL